MRKITTALVVTLLTAAAAQAQTTGTQFGLKTGLSLAVLDGTVNKGSEYKAGFHLGAFLRWRPTAHFALQPELVYAQQGCNNHVPAGIFYPNDLDGKTKLSYLNVPIMAKVYLGKVFYLQAGPQFGLLLAGRETGRTIANPTVEADLDVKDDYKGDVALCLGLGADLPIGLTLGARANYGLTDINNNELDKQMRDTFGIGGLHNRVIEVSVGYAFGGK